MAEKFAEINKMDQPLPLWGVILVPIYILVWMSVLIFPFAGDWQWIYGWIFVITTTINLIVSYIIINNKNPRVIRNRSKIKKEGITDDTKKAVSSDQFIYPLIIIGFFGTLIVSSLGHRFDWFTLPFVVSIGSAVIMNVGLVVVNMATLQNSYASKLLDINKDQVLIDTGLYSQVRHPLYSGGIIVILFTPIVLGSLWGLIPALLGALSMVVRIEFEEEMLLKGMEGYKDYQSRVKYKLIPKVY
ncbi:MAG: isoprenylcysteine carboxylmethyltransferase family protein [Anaerolineales bacterium]|uniref:Isoprenylcysteine carboxylmethyltransferase family protein n=1 Tax=Candidatus Desulfolinea nitratireducens TaxID=2841698 RepID=A0A8J6NGY5_9CHLR|nr:isoprenylcysteine carboxylmethyltransferase family protein [Candidatus Desulfolinea nitratireducens]